MSGPRTLIWDIECSNLNANYGFILCIGHKWAGEKSKPQIISIRDFPLYQRDPTNDREVVKAFGKIFEQADAHVAHFGKYFDVPYVNTRRLYHGLHPLPPAKLVDTWRLAKNNLKLNSNRLATITEFFGLTRKTPVTGPHWIKAMAGNKQSLRYVEKHCYYDIEALEDTYAILKAFQPTFPTKTDGTFCPHCHATDTKKTRVLQRRGTYLASTNRFQRYQCKQCGKWSPDKKALKP